MPTNHSDPKSGRKIPGARWFLYGAGAAGMVNAVEESLDEANAPREPFDPTTPVEHHEVDAKRILYVGLGLLLTVWAVVVGMYLLFNFFTHDRTGGPAPSKVLVFLPKMPPEPRNEANPLRDFNNYQARQEGALNSYYWVDRDKGMVAIPIGRAMQIVAAKGIPPSAPGGSAYYKPQAGTKVTGFEGKVEPVPR